MAIHAAVGLAQHLRVLVALRACDDRCVRRYHADPEIDAHAHQAGDDADNHKDAGDDLARLTEHDDADRPEYAHSEAQHDEQKSPSAQSRNFTRFPVHTVIPIL